MKEILNEVYQHCLDMQKIAETKNAGLIALNGAIVVGVSTILLNENLNIYVLSYLLFLLVCTLISIFINLSAISAQLKHKECEVTNFDCENLLFFGTAANYTAKDYLRKLSKKYCNNEKPSKYHKDLSKQIVINAQIALRKFKMFNSAFKWTISGIATPLSVILYLLIFDNNK